MPSKLWVKVWVESLGDVKVSRLPDHLWRRFYECVELAGIRNEGGLLPSMDDCCWILHTDETALVMDLGKLSERGLIEETESGWLVINWTKRQDSPEATRQRRYRERQKATTTDETNNVTNNVTVVHNNSASTSASASTSLINLNINKNGEIRKLYSLYESEIGTITKNIADRLNAAWDEYDHGWFEIAFSEASSHNARSWKYVEAILKRWKADGFQSKKGKGGAQKESIFDRERRRIAEEEAAKNGKRETD